MLYNLLFYILSFAITATLLPVIHTHVKAPVIKYEQLEPLVSCHPRHVSFVQSP